MILSEVMTPDPKTCSEEDSIRDCARIMADHNVGFLPVVNELGRLVGVITDRDITTRATAIGISGDAKVGDICSDNPVHMEPTDTLERAEDLLMDAHIRRLVVVDKEKRPVGVVSLCDVGRFDEDADRVTDVFATVLEPMPQSRTVADLVGSPCCG